MVKVRYLNAFREVVKKEELDPAGEGEGCFGALIVCLVALLGATVVLIPAAVWVHRRWKTVKRHHDTLRDVHRFAERSLPVMAIPLMANVTLLSSGDAPAPGLFLISFDPAFGNSSRPMGELAVRVGEGDPRGMSAEAHRFCRDLMADEEFEPYRRRRIPDELTGGAAVYAIDLMLDPMLLVGRHISAEMPVVPCIAEPGDSGRVAQLPYWFLTGTEPPGRRNSGRF